MKFFESRFTFAAIALAFTLTLGWNAMKGSEMAIPLHGIAVPELVLAAHGPSLPPDPWVGGRSA